MTNPLVNILTPKVRGYLYAAYFLAGVILGACQLAGLDTGRTSDVLVYIGAALGLTAASNASTTPVPTATPRRRRRRRTQAGAVTLTAELVVLCILTLVVVLWWFGVRP